MTTVHDPRGYYRIMGLKPTAEPAAIKRAYRRRAKELHPDRNPSPLAREDFQLLTEAYHVLADADRRADYDAGRVKAAQRGRSNHTEQPQQRRPQPGSAKPQGKPHTHAHAHSQPHAPGQTAGIEPFTCERCGKLAAQPRYLVFPRVRGAVVKSIQAAREGIFCRGCADRTALEAALYTWLLGWWSLPWGPSHTVRALMVNLRGGEAPRERNYRLLVQQARAFLARRQNDLARGVALQALSFAGDASEKRDANSLIAAAQGRADRVLRDRWRGLGIWRLAQLVPPAVLAFTAYMLLTAPTDGRPIAALPDRPDLSPMPELENTNIPGLERPLLLRTGQLYEVTARRLPVRSGPGPSHAEATVLEMGTTVLVMENAPGGGWVRVLTAEGVSGFVAGRYLTPGLVGRALDGSLRGTGGDMAD